MFRFTNILTRCNITRTSNTNSILIRRSINLENGPYYAPAIATKTTAEQEETVKPFDAIPTRNSNIWQLIVDLIKLRRKDWFTRPDLMSQENADKYGPILRNYLGAGNSYIVEISDPNLVEKVLRAEGKYPERMTLIPWKDYRVTRNIPLGLFLHDGKEWHRNRQAIGKHILKPAEMSQYIPAMVEITNDTISRLRRNKIGEGDRNDIVPDLEEDLFKWSMEGAVKVLLDKRLGLLSEKLDKQSQKFIDAIQDVFITTLDLFIFTNVHKRLNTKPWKRHVEGWDTTIAVTKDLIEHHVNEMMSAKEKGEHLETNTFLGALISGSDLTRAEIFGNLSELIGAAIDTTSYTLVWVLYFLAHNPECQQKLRDEILEVLPVSKKITKEDLAKLVYTKMVIKESMRLVPVASSITRKLDSDIVLGGYLVPAKTTIVIQFFPMVKNPKTFEEPLKFRPERWDRTEGNTSHPFASIPFGFGTRMCVGRRFAEQEMHLLLSEIIRQFDVVPTKKVEMKSKLIIVPAEPVDLKFVDRT
ncbi:1,25-dihydroxyvitamin D(3) 24-hydroxylase, mitochondrial-like [Antedon mediterranea]|uniref:1,25-dihydroxyvitamin D(3) 24-hydroxylase, mitochondrial-like n=1 Tax=Antedon mediterranea TaxID=105859 RepID=UPI003AF9223C